VNDQDLCFMPLADLSVALHRRDLSPVDVVAALLRRAERVQSRLNCYITVLADYALRRAQVLETLLARGTSLGPLHGIPISLKDNIATAGIETTAGSKVLAGWVPENDATVAARLHAGGAVLLAKAHLYEFAYGLPHPHFGSARNPWNLNYESGGSSSGSASSVGGGLCYGSLGTDTGGSIRVPASFCGVVGLKPTYGLVSRKGVIPVSYNLDAVGPITRTVRDAALMLQVIEGHDPNDPTTVCRPIRHYTAEVNRGVRGLRLGVPSAQVGAFAQEEILVAFEEAGRVLEREGAILVEVSLPDLALAQAVVEVISATEAADYHAPYVKSRPEDYHPDVRLRLMRGRFIPATEYVRAQRVRQKLINDLRSTLLQVDALLLPAHATGSHPIGLKTLRINGREMESAEVNSHYTRLFNLTGEPGIVLTCGFTSIGLPIGLQVVGRSFDEAMVFRVAGAYERATDWHRRHPEVEV
jgi:aspartyl-tRNA(Asn)/glutamyl-tRNA(Gln) amidotransferase subunit A